MSSPPVKRALISVSDKQQLADFARELVACGIEIYSSGGTCAHLRQAGLDVREVSEYTGFPEMLEGRLKTLHPKIHGGILARHDMASDMTSLAEHGIVTFELVVVNLYPFQQTVARPEVTLDEAIENIDIGGPTMVRSAAKNHAHVAIVTSPEQYSEVLAEIQLTRRTTPELRRRLALAAFEHTARYDRAIADFLSGAGYGGPAGEGADDDAALVRDFPRSLQLSLQRTAVLRYGENPHQRGAVYAETGSGGLVAARQLNGKELSYNNLLDLDSALAIVRGLPGPAVSVIKHNNPCGAATADNLAEAARRAMDADPLSAFGAVLGINRKVDAATADVLTAPGTFIEAIAAPAFEEAALDILTTRPKWKVNVRLLATGSLAVTGGYRELRRISGGYLCQDADVGSDPESEWQVVTARQPSPRERDELSFAWAVVRHVKSNAIVVTHEGALCGTGAGQMSRVDSVEIALRKAGEQAKGAVLGSDAFFPFPDSIDLAAAAGIRAIIQPGGSKKDDEVIAACDRYSIAMVFTGRRHFKH
ncbi:MAG: bifunctional phosphoribosylaminoimidazolecarboxamide formyltransferase/IMP cyclohydrolase [Pirellulales bacterium]|nr:bifunctional phosphoribosylaminoimidazolecarboxamide formyltransferase/IMP cyclohydrolase [Pirellulales bacterium]